MPEAFSNVLQAPDLLQLTWLTHGFGQRHTLYPPGIITRKQIHSDLITDPGSDIAEADALVTNVPATLVGVKTADCVPILLADPQTKSVAAIHAGWRGTAARIAARAVAEMERRYGSNAPNLIAAIGPAIGECCYEVSPDVAHQFRKETTHLNLAKINRSQLEEAGVRNVWLASECTCCHPDRYFSWRGQRETTGRMISFIGLK